MNEWMNERMNEWNMMRVFLNYKFQMALQWYFPNRCVQPFCQKTVQCRYGDNLALALESNEVKNCCIQQNKKCGSRTCNLELLSIDSRVSAVPHNINTNVQYKIYSQKMGHLVQKWP